MSKVKKDSINEDGNDFAMGGLVGFMSGALLVLILSSCIDEHMTLVLTGPNKYYLYDCNVTHGGSCTFKRTEDK